MVATISSKGQLTIPLAIRNSLRLRTGDKVDFLLLDTGRLELVPHRASVTALRGMAPASDGGQGRLLRLSDRRTGAGGRSPDDAFVRRGRLFLRPLRVRVRRSRPPRSAKSPRSGNFPGLRPLDNRTKRRQDNRSRPGRLRRRGLDAVVLRSCRPVVERPDRGEDLPFSGRTTAGGRYWPTDTRKKRAPEAEGSAGSTARQPSEGASESRPQSV